MVAKYLLDNECYLGEAWEQKNGFPGNKKRNIVCLSQMEDLSRADWKLRNRDFSCILAKCMNTESIELGWHHGSITGDCFAPHHVIVWYKPFQGIAPYLFFGTDWCTKESFSLIILNLGSPYLQLDGSSLYSLLRTWLAGVRDSAAGQP